MRILIIGQCTLHWGRMEFGNIGNFYIADPLFSQLRRVYPQCKIATTMQFSQDFCNKYEVETLPMDLYYDFASDDNLDKAKAEYDAVMNGEFECSEYVKEVRAADLVIDFSGDLWGRNADFLGKDRFAAGCYKDLTAQALRPAIMTAGSPGPFNSDTVELAKKVYAGFGLVINRESVSTRLLEHQGFEMANTMTFPCPSFLFKPADKNNLSAVIREYSLDNREVMKIGLILCGWNFEKGPFDLWPREEKEYERFAKMAEAVIRKYNCVVYLLSHANGFEIPMKTFKLTHGRDYPIMEQFRKILSAKGLDKHRIVLMEGRYLPDITKGIIGNFDILISGRLHGAAAGISQGIPTVMIDYGHEPRAHKLKGFAEMAGMSQYIADPNDMHDLMAKVEKCIAHKEEIREKLNKQMQTVNCEAARQFDVIKARFGYLSCQKGEGAFFEGGG